MPRLLCVDTSAELLGAALCLYTPGGAVARPRIHAERTGGEWPGGAVGVNGEDVMILVVSTCSEGKFAIMHDDGGQQ